MEHASASENNNDQIFPWLDEGDASQDLCFQPITEPQNLLGATGNTLQSLGDGDWSWRSILEPKTPEIDPNIVWVNKEDFDKLVTQVQNMESRNEE